MGGEVCTFQCTSAQVYFFNCVCLETCISYLNYDQEITIICLRFLFQSLASKLLLALEYFLSLITSASCKVSYMTDILHRLCFMLTSIFFPHSSTDNVVKLQSSHRNIFGLGIKSTRPCQLGLCGPVFHRLLGLGSVSTLHVLLAEKCWHGAG